MIGKSFFTEMWRHPIHTREFGSHITNVMRCLKLEAQMNNYILMFKMFDTWVQRLEVYKTENGTNLIPYFVESSPMELNVKGFSNWIDEQISTLN